MTARILFLLLHLLQYVVWLKYKKILLHKVGKGTSTLTALSNNCGYSPLKLYQKLSEFLKE